MLGKLLKYETRATARWYAPIYAGIILLSLINKLFMIISENDTVARILYGNHMMSSLFYLVQGLLVTGYVVAIMGAFVMTFVLAIYRFYKNLLGDEGYLMFTLPAKASEHIWSKLLVSAMWIIASAVVAGLSLFIILFEGNLLYFTGEFFSNIRSILESTQGIHAIFFVIEIIVAIIVALACSLMMLYASMATGHLKQNHRILYSLAAFIVFNIIMQIVSGVIFFIGAVALSTDPFTNTMQLPVPPTWIIHVIMIGVLLLEVVYGTVYYAITNNILSKKLNLE